MLWQKATSTYIHTAVNSPSAESASGMHSAHKASAVWKTADKIILLFHLLWKVRFGFEGQLSRAFQLVSSKANGRTLVLVSHLSQVKDSRQLRGKSPGLGFWICCFLSTAVWCNVQCYQDTNISTWLCSMPGMPCELPFGLGINCMALVVVWGKCLYQCPDGIKIVCSLKKRK